MDSAPLYELIQVKMLRKRRKSDKKELEKFSLFGIIRNYSFKNGQTLSLEILKTQNFVVFNLLLF